MCQKSLSQTCFRTAGALEEQAQPSRPREATVINSICSAWCLGQDEGDLGLFRKLGPNQLGACSPFTGLSKPHVLQIVAEKPAAGLAKAKYPPLSIFRPLIFPFIHVFSVFQPVGIGPRTDWPGSFQGRSHGRGLDGPC